MVWLLNCQGIEEGNEMSYILEKNYSKICNNAEYLIWERFGHQ